MANLLNDINKIRKPIMNDLGLLIAKRYGFSLTGTSASEVNIFRPLLKLPFSCRTLMKNEFNTCLCNFIILTKKRELRFKIFDVT